MEKSSEATFTLLKELNQNHLIEEISKKTPEEQQEFCQQVIKLNESYPGGLKEYISRAKVLLENSANDVNPYEGFEASIPSGETVNFYDSKGLKELEEIGEKEIGSACFVLVAGGLGERLGYPSIKVSIPVELVTLKTFLQFYIEHILAIQKKNSDVEIPLAIMTSDDTYSRTVKLLNEHSNFGMSKDQLTIMKQEKVPSMLNNDCHLVLNGDSHLLDTKPHGHGDVHTLLYQNQLPQKWKDAGKKWAIFFQDTNPLVFRAYPSVLGVSKKNSFEMNTITVPRKPGEAVGAICRLQHENGKNLTINVEYNQLGALMNGQSEPLDDQGYSKYPGNTNSFILSIPEYAATLEKTKGNISEFINPKYTDSTKTAFKTPTRLECMMQDYPKLLPNCDKVGFTQIDKKFCFSTVKNDIVTASQKFASKLSPESASSCEFDVYWLNCELLKLAGVEFYGEVQSHSYAGIEFAYPAKVSLHPQFGFTVEQIKEKIKGKVRISNSSALYIGPKASFDNVDIDGVYEINSEVSNKELKNQKKFNFIEIPNESNEEDYLKIRGYKSEHLELEKI